MSFNIITKLSESIIEKNLISSIYFIILIYQEMR